MTDLEHYRSVSSMPAVTRDLSIAVDGDDTAEDLGDRVRDALGDDASSVEEVRVLSATPVSDLPPAAVVRLGARPGQQNILVRRCAPRPRADPYRRGGERTEGPHLSGPSQRGRSRMGGRAGSPMRV